MGRAALVPKIIDRVDGLSSNIAEMCSLFAAQRGSTSIRKYPQTSGVPCIREFYENKEFSPELVSIIMSSWRKSTIKQYETYFRKWCTFCHEQKIDPLQNSEINVVEFLNILFQLNYSYSAINSVRSMLSGLLWNEYGLTVGKQPTVKRFLKGVFECRLPIPKYVDIWDVNIVLDYLKLLFPLSELSLRILTHKLVMLMKLVTAQRLQTLSLLDTKNLILDENKM